MSATASQFIGAGVPMVASDITAAAVRTGCEEAVIRAVLDIESSGKGFDAQGRPKALFERHIFWRELASNPPLQRRAVDLQLAYPQQGTRPYPRTSDGVYAEILAASALDPVAALRSASWGIAQVMGFNATICGYADAAAMVRAFMDREAAGFDAMLAYCDHNHLLAPLKRHDFLIFAAGYNGRGAQAAYAAKLAVAYQHHLQPAATVHAPTPIATLQQPWAFDRPARNPNQLADPQWLRIRSNLPELTADQLNLLELNRLGVHAP